MIEHYWNDIDFLIYALQFCRKMQSERHLNQFKADPLTAWCMYSEFKHRQYQRNDGSSSAYDGEDGPQSTHDFIKRKVSRSSESEDSKSHRISIQQNQRSSTVQQPIKYLKNRVKSRIRRSEMIELCGMRREISNCAGKIYMQRENVLERNHENGNFMESGSTYLGAETYSTRRKISLVPAAARRPAAAAVPTEGGLRRLYLLDDARKVSHPQRSEHLDGLLVDLDPLRLDGGHIGHEVHAALSLLLLQLERDAPHRPALDALHQVGGEPGYLVAEPLGGDDGDLLQDLLVGVEVEGHPRVVPLDHLPGRLLHRLRAHATHLFPITLSLPPCLLPTSPANLGLGFTDICRRRFEEATIAGRVFILASLNGPHQASLLIGPINIWTWASSRKETRAWVVKRKAQNRSLSGVNTSLSSID